MINAPVTVTNRVVTATVSADGRTVTAVVSSVPTKINAPVLSGRIINIHRAEAIAATAGETIGGHRVVQIYDGEATYADKDTAYSGQLALSTGAVMSGAEGVFAIAGIVEEPTWSWTIGPVYLGSNGLLQQTKPSTGTVVMIGRAVSATSLSIDIMQLYRRA